MSLTQVRTSHRLAMDERIEAGPSMAAGSHQTRADRLRLSIGPKTFFAHLASCSLEYRAAVMERRRQSQLPVLAIGSG